MNLDKDFYPKHKIEFILHIEADEKLGKVLREEKEEKYNKLYGGMNHNDIVRDSGRKDWSF